MKTGKLHALLIGIDQYIPPRRPGEIDYPPLEGAVGDIRRVRDFLLELATPPTRILELTASSGDGTEPIEPRDRWPTYEAMVSKFRELTAGAERGDQVYVHYSGHGGRVPTIFPKEKVTGLDETLVPCDVADSSARHLRDVELGMLIQEMVDKGLLATVILDCCHSGGMRRRGPRKPHPGRAVPRGVDTPDRRPRPQESLVGTREQLAAFLRPNPPAVPGMRTFRHARLDGGLVEPHGYVMFAACRPQEKAFEDPFDGEESQGALTHYLLSTLRAGGIEATWREIESIVSPQVHVRFPAQAPMLYGEKGRRFLGGSIGDEENPPEGDGLAGVSVLAVQGSWVLLSAGEAAGIREDMRFAIYPPALDRQLAGRRLAEAEIRKVGAAESWAEIVKTHFRTAIREGGRAAPLGGIAVGRPALCAIVNGETAADRTSALGRAMEAIVNDGTGAVKIAEEGEAADFRVSVNERGDYEIRDTAGQPLVNLGPAVSALAPAAEAELLRRLIHLAMYRDLEQLENKSVGSPLEGKLRLRATRSRASAGPGGIIEQAVSTDEATGDGGIDLRSGESLVLEIENQYTRPLNVVVLDLQPDWGITQIFPTQRDGEFCPLDPGEKKTIGIKGYLPDGCEEKRDIIKVFATLGVPSFFWREMTPLNRPVARHRLTRTFRGDVPEDVINSVPLAVGKRAGRDWATTQLEVRVRG